MHANEALNARAELKNKEVTSSTSLREPEPCLRVSALKAAQHVGRYRRCHLMVRARTQTPLSCCSPPPPTASNPVPQKVESSKIKTR